MDFSSTSPNDAATWTAHPEGGTFAQVWRSTPTFSPSNAEVADLELAEKLGRSGVWTRQEL